MPSALSSLSNYPRPSSAKLGNIEARLKPQMPHDTVRWVKADSIHLTLKFLGQVPSDQLELITSSLRTAVAAHAPFTLEVDDAGCFPNIHRPRVVWVGVHETIDHRLHALQRAVENAIAPLGYPTRSATSRRISRWAAWRATCARSIRRRSAMWCRPPAVGSLGKWEVKQVALIKSDLKPSGAEYTILAHAPLTGNSKDLGRLPLICQAFLADGSCSSIVLKPDSNSPKR